MDSQQEEEAQITMTATTLSPTSSSGIRHSLKQYGGKHFVLNPLTPRNFAKKGILKLFGPSSVHCLATES